MNQQIDITIGPDGTVIVHVQGVAGMACADLTGGLLAQLGAVIEQQFTMDAYHDGGRAFGDAEARFSYEERYRND